MQKNCMKRRENGYFGQKAERAGQKGLIVSLVKMIRRIPFYAQFDADWFVSCEVIEEADRELYSYAAYGDLKI